jgi:hypothetical protein
MVTLKKYIKIHFNQNLNDLELIAYPFPPNPTQSVVLKMLNRRSDFFDETSDSNCEAKSLHCS